MRPCLPPPNHCKRRKCHIAYLEVYIWSAWGSGTMWKACASVAQRLPGRRWWTASARCSAVRRVPASPQDDVSSFRRSFITLVLCTRLFPCLSTLRIICSCSSPVAGIFLGIVKLLWLLEFKYFPQVIFFLLLCSWPFCHKVCLVFFETDSHSIA